jgi:hypothetical protein
MGRLRPALLTEELVVAGTRRSDAGACNQQAASCPAPTSKLGGVCRLQISMA